MTQTNEARIEQEIQEKGLTTPGITLEQVNNLMTMKTYQSYKVVKADKVAIIAEDFYSEEGLRNVPVEKIVALQSIATGAHYKDLDFKRLFARGLPQTLHFYLVQYDDGYTSWSPKDAFEQGYTLLETVDTNQNNS